MKTHDYVHRYRGYWSEGGRCGIRIYQGGGTRAGGDLLAAKRQ